MSLFSNLKGAKTFESNPVWQPMKDSEVIVVDLAKSPGVELVELQYGYALREGDTWVLLKRGVSPSKTVYRVRDFEAVKDWENENGGGRITKGEIKSLAY